MTKPRRPIRHLGVIAAVGVVAALALGGCTPSGLDVESRTTRSAYRTLTGRTATGNVTCRFERLSDDSSGSERYSGSCVVNGQSFRMLAVYDGVGSGYTTADVWAGLPTRRVRVHACSWAQRGDGPWELTAPCGTGDWPGYS